MATARMTDDLLKKLCDKFQEDYRKVNPVPRMSEDLGLKIYKKYVEPMFADMKAVYDTHMEKTTVYGTENKKDLFQTNAEFDVLVSAPQVLTKQQEHRLTKKDSEGYAKSIDWQLRDYTNSYEWDSEEHELQRVTFQLPYEAEFLTDRYNNALAIHLHNESEDELYRQCVDEWTAMKNAEFKMKNDTKEYFNTLDRFETLNQALKAWPQLANAVEEVMPEKMVAVHKRTERKKKQQENQQMVEEVSQKFNNVMLSSTLLGDDDE